MPLAVEMLQPKADRRQQVAGGLSVSKKSAYGVLFRDLRRFPLAPMGLPGGKRRKETLHSKASESAAHVAGFGLHLEGYGPPNHPKRFFDSLRAVSLQG